MVERQDIDALLIGALYGELTPADEARLSAHLESHPTDRSALDDLKLARQAVRESRIFEAQVEPPQALSALLLQEAARRAPRRVADPEAKEGWFHRFTRSFMAHPAMAAAAMLVLVLGVASTLYVRHGGELAEKTVSISTPTGASPAAQPAEEVARPDIAQGSTAAVAQGSGYAIGLAENDGEQDHRREAATKGAADSAGDRMRDGKDAQATAKPVQHAAPKKPYLEVASPEPAPKEMTRSKAKADEKLRGGEKNELAFDSDEPAAAGPAAGMAPGGGGAGRAATGGVAPAQPARNAPATTTAAAPPPPPAQAMPRDDDKVAGAKYAPPPDVAKKSAVAEPKPAPAKTVAKDDPQVAWAKGQHATLQAQVRAGNCTDAAVTALQLKNRAPEYFSQYVATDRVLKPCMQYISQAADKEPAKRAQKRVNADESVK